MDYAKIAANPADYGFKWEIEEVQKQYGDHATDRQVVGEIPIIVVTDFPKFRESFGDDLLTDWLNKSNSIRVACQNKGRPAVANGNPDMEELKEAAVRLLCGARSRTVRVETREVETYILPDGSKTLDKDEALTAWKNA